MTAAVMNAPTDIMAARTGPLVAGAVAWVLMLAGGWWLVQGDDARTISRVQIDGSFQRVSAETARAAIHARLGESFVELPLERVKDDLEALPWVARARVERAWPAGIRVRIWEREAAALWGESSLLDTEGRVFTPALDERPQHLPRLGGGSGQEREVMQLYRQLDAQLADTPFALSGLTRDVRGEWTAQTQAGIGLRFGQSPDQAKLLLLRGTVAQSLRERMSEVEYVDLRYTNGFAVGWKQQPQAATGETHG